VLEHDDKRTSITDRKNNLFIPANIAYITQRANKKAHWGQTPIAQNSYICIDERIHPAK